MINNGMDPDNDVTLNYFSGSTELAGNFISGEANYALIPEPLLTNVLMKRTDAKVVIDMQEAWSETTGLDNYPQASLVISTKLIEEHPDVVESFLEIYNESTDWINENPSEAGVYYENLEIGLNAAIIAKAMDGSNIDFVYARDAKEALDAYLQVLYDFNPGLIGGKMPDEGFYFEQ
jgi:NitT/TauT family transport system substrate-binding protein